MKKLLIISVLVLGLLIANSAYAAPTGCYGWNAFSVTTGASCTASASLPYGCTSTTGFSPLTGMKCDTPVDTSLPLGCTTTSGYSPLSGVPCSGGVSLPEGCLSGDAFSRTTGLSCTAPVTAPTKNIISNNVTTMPTITHNYVLSLTNTNDSKNPDVPSRTPNLEYHYVSGNENTTKLYNAHGLLTLTDNGSEIKLPDVTVTTDSPDFPTVGVASDGSFILFSRENKGQGTLSDIVPGNYTLTVSIPSLNITQTFPFSVVKD